MAFGILDNTDDTIDVTVFCAALNRKNTCTGNNYIDINRHHLHTCGCRFFIREISND